MATSPSTSFSGTELNTALSEVGWGLMAWEILLPPFCPPNESRAKVELLEPGDSAIISVDQAGWKIIMRSVADPKRAPEDGAAKDDQVWETVEHLLAYVSPLFERRRMKLLTESLENISVRRSWNEDGA